MKTLKKLGLGFFGLLVLIVLVAFLLPGKMHVERSLVIKAGAEPVYNQVNTLKNWEKWSPWHQIDPNMQLSYAGPVSGPGASYSWTSEHDQVGNGKLTIAETQANQFIKTAMEFDGMGTTYATYTFEPVAEGTKVTWGMDSDCADMPWQFYVPSKYMGLFMDGMIGKDFEKGLNNLKQVVETAPVAAAPTFKVEEKTLAPQQVLSIKAVCSQDELANKLGELYGKILADMKKNNLQFAGHPFAIYHKYDPVAIEFEAGIPVNKAGKTNGIVTARELKGGPVAMIAHLGPYEETFAAHMYMDQWLTQHKKAASGAPWEVYVTDPGKEKDPAKWLTEVYYPL